MKISPAQEYEQNNLSPMVEYYNDPDVDYCDDCNAPMVWCVCECCDSCGNFLCSCNDPDLNPNSPNYGKVLMKVKCEDCERLLYFFNEDEADYVLSNHDCGAY